MKKMERREEALSGRENLNKTEKKGSRKKRREREKKSNKKKGIEREEKRRKSWLHVKIQLTEYKP